MTSMTGLRLIPSEDRMLQSPIASEIGNDLVESNIADADATAWLVALGSFLSLFSAFGVVNSFGVFQEHYNSTLLKGYPPAIIALIGAIQLFLIYGLAPVVGRIFDVYGTKILMPAGTFITVFALMMTSLCEDGRLYQFFLAQGILFGFGNALLFTPSLAIVNQWFPRHRAFAIGIVASGSALGGVVYPIMLKHLIVKLGFAWTVRICALLTLACLVVSCLTMRTRLPLSGTMTMTSAVDFAGFRDTRYTLAAIAAFLLLYALFIPYFYIEDYAKYYGVSPHVTPYLLAILNACGIPARIIPGIIADRLGVLNVFVPATFMTALLVVGLWLPSRGTVPVTLFSAFYGLFSGSFLSLLPAYIATITPREKYGARLGMIYLIIAVANLAGPPSAGAFLATADAQHFQHLIIFTGVLLACGGLTLAVARGVDSHSRYDASCVI